MLLPSKFWGNQTLGVTVGISAEDLAYRLSSLVPQRQKAEPLPIFSQTPHPSAHKD